MILETKSTNTGVIRLKCTREDHVMRNVFILFNQISIQGNNTTQTQTKRSRTSQAQAGSPQMASPSPLPPPCFPPSPPCPS